MIEIYKYIPNYEGIYQASNLGNVRSLDRNVEGVNGVIQKRKGTVLKPVKNRCGYMMVTFVKDNVRKTNTVHQLVFSAFTGYLPNGKNGFDIDHINENKADNRISNLRLITSRENTVRSNKRGLSKYVGVTQKGKKWCSRISINGIREYLGTFNSEYDAHLAYQNKLKELTYGS